MQFPSSHVLNNLLSLFHILCASCLSIVLFPQLGFEFKMYTVTSHPLLLSSGGIGEKMNFLCFSLGDWSHD